MAWKILGDGLKAILCVGELKEERSVCGRSAWVARPWVRCRPRKRCDTVMCPVMH